MGATINHNYDKLGAGYLFPEISRRVSAYKETHPGVEIIRLGIGDTTEPLPESLVRGLVHGSQKLASRATYSGYGDEQGDKRLRQAIVERHYAPRNVSLDISEVFVSDGAKCDSGNIQSIFGLENVVAVADPAYPVYVDTNVIAGRTGKFNTETKTYDGILYMPCRESNGFVPAIPTIPGTDSDAKADLIYLCSPNNPTGAVMTRPQMQSFVDFARRNKSVIIFDAAYSQFIKDSSLPRSIYEVEGARECAIELQSFSKSAGFTGVRLGWAVVPKQLVTADSPAGKVNQLWNRRQTTFFNGASNVVQEGGLAALSEEGMADCEKVINYYMENAKLIKEGLSSVGMKAHWQGNAPYIWTETPGRKDSWEFFDEMLDKAHVVITPGVGFGPSGQGFFRVSAFGHRENVEKAVENIKQAFK